jgi:hypothetical protein
MWGRRNGPRGGIGGWLSHRDGLSHPGADEPRAPAQERGRIHAPAPRRLDLQQQEAAVGRREREARSVIAEKVPGLVAGLCGGNPGSKDGDPATRHLEERARPQPESPNLPLERSRRSR